MSFFYDKLDYIYFRNASNLGPGASRNVGLNYAKGDYIVFLDSDDYWDCEFLDKIMLTFNKNPEVVMAYSDGMNVQHDNSKILRSMDKTAPDEIMPNILFNGRYWGTGACVWNKNEIQEIEWLSTRAWEDYAFDISCAQSNNKVAYVNEALVYYDISGNDKLSNASLANAFMEKNRSIYQIALSISKDHFFNIKGIKNKMLILVISNTLGLLKENVTDARFYKRNRKIFKIYSHTYHFMMYKIANILKGNLRLKVLRKLRSMLH